MCHEGCAMRAPPQSEGFVSRTEQKSRQRKAYHAAHREKQSSSTPGKGKGGTCMASRMDRFFAKYSRARKHAGYPEWLASHRG